jgi:hypothetical protein
MQRQYKLLIHSDNDTLSDKVTEMISKPSEANYFRWQLYGNPIIGVDPIEANKWVFAQAVTREERGEKPVPTSPSHSASSH